MRSGKSFFISALVLAIVATWECHPSGATAKDKAPDQLAGETVDTMPSDPDAAVVDGNDPRPFEVVTESDSAKAKRRAEESKRKRETEGGYLPGKTEAKPHDPPKRVLDKPSIGKHEVKGIPPKKKQEA